MEKIRAKRLKQKMKSLGMSQNAMSAALKIFPSELSAMLGGHKHMPDNVRILANRELRKFANAQIKKAKKILDEKEETP